MPALLMEKGAVLKGYRGEGLLTGGLLLLSAIAETNLSEVCGKRQGAAAKGGFIFIIVSKRLGVEAGHCRPGHA